MDCVTSLEQLIEKLDQGYATNEAKIIKEMQIPASDFESYCSWDSKGYTRNCVARTPTYEIILLCWNEADETPIHGHGGQRCWVYQVEGQLTEVRYIKQESGELLENSRTEMSPGMLSFMNDSMGYHKLINGTDGRSMTLHVYVAPIDSCEVFDADCAEFKQKEMQYDTMRGKAIS